MKTKKSVLLNVMFAMLSFLAYTAPALAQSPQLSPSPSPTGCAMRDKSKSDFILSTQAASVGMPRTELRIAANGAAVTFTQQYPATATTKEITTVFQADLERGMFIKGLASRFDFVASSKLLCPNMMYQPGDWYMIGLTINNSFRFARSAAELTGNIPDALKRAIQRASTALATLYPEFASTSASKNSQLKSILSLFSVRGDTENPLYALTVLSSVKVFVWNTKSGVISVVTPEKSVNYNMHIPAQNDLYLNTVLGMDEPASEGMMLNTQSPAKASPYISLVFRVMAEQL